MPGGNKLDTVIRLEIDRSIHNVTFARGKKRYNDQRSKTVGNRSLAKRVNSVSLMHRPYPGVLPGSHEIQHMCLAIEFSGVRSQKRLNRNSRKQSNRHVKIKSLLSLLAAGSLALTSAAFAAGAKTYEVTGPVLEVNDSMIVVQKGKDRWEINRDANTKVTGDVKVGDKVHVTYTMSATNVEVKAGKGAKKEGAKAAPTP